MRLTSIPQILNHQTIRRINDEVTPKVWTKNFWGHFKH